MLKKFGKSGNLLFDKNYGDSNAYSKNNQTMFQLAEEDYLTFTGFVYEHGDCRLVITKLYSSGSFLWRKFYGDTLNIYPVWFGEGILKDKFNSTYIVSGYKQQLNPLLYYTKFCSLATYDFPGNFICKN